MPGTCNPNKHQLKERTTNTTKAMTHFNECTKITLQIDGRVCSTEMEGNEHTATEIIEAFIGLMVGQTFTERTCYKAMNKIAEERNHLFIGGEKESNEIDDSKNQYNYGLYSTVVLTHFKVPLPFDDVEYMTTTEMHQYLSMYNKEIQLHHLGVALKKLGFKLTRAPATAPNHYRTARVWEVLKRH